MKVLLVAAFPIDSAGGVNTYVKELKSGLQGLGHDVSTFAPHPTLPSHYALDDEVFDKESIRRLVYPKVQHSIRHVVPPTQRALIQYLEVERYCLEAAFLTLGSTHYDIIHAQDVVSSAAVSRVKSRSTGLVTTLHSLMHAEFLIQARVSLSDTVLLRYMKRLEEKAVLASDATVTPSQWLMSLIGSELDISGAKCIVIPSGLDVGRFQVGVNQPALLRFPAGKQHIVCPARLDAVKGHDVLLDALARLAQVRTDWMCWLLGEGPRQADLQKRARALGLSKQVVFAGSRSDVAALLKQADVVVLSSLLENRPFAVMEAQLAGIPVVVTAAGGISELVVDGVTGLVCPVQDSAALSANLNRVLSDKDLRTRLAEAGRQFAVHAYDGQRMLARTVEVYRDAQSQRIRETGKRSGPGASAIVWESTKRPDTSRVSHRKYVPAGNFASLFRNDLVHAPAPQVPYAVWDRIMANAPPGYHIPDDLLTTSLGRDPCGSRGGRP